MRVPADARAGEVSVGQEPPLSVKWRAVAMETRGKEDHDVGLLALVLDLRVGHFLCGTEHGVAAAQAGGGGGATDLEGERRDALPHPEGSPHRPLGVLLTHFRGEVGNTAGNRERMKVCATSCPEA